MKVSREKVAENRKAIVAAAGRLFRERGFDAVGVSEVMKAAGLTHGAFYGYFASKDDLIAATLASLAASSPAEPETSCDYADRYLTDEHRGDHAGGCWVASLGSELVRQAGEVRGPSTDAIRRQIDRMTGDADGADRRAAIGYYAAMIGAVVLARISNDPALSSEILDQTRRFIAAKA